MPRFVFTDVLRRLVADSVAIRDLGHILLRSPMRADSARSDSLTWTVRASLRRHSTHQASRGQSLLTVLLHPQLEDEIRRDLAALQSRAIFEAIGEPYPRLAKDVYRTQQLLASRGFDGRMRHQLQAWLETFGSSGGPASSRYSKRLMARGRLR